MQNRWPVRALSYTGISMWDLCRLKWYIRYVHKPKLPTSPYLVFGSAWHTAVQQFIRQEGKSDLLPLWRRAWSLELGKANRSMGVKWGNLIPKTFSTRGDVLAVDSRVLSIVNDLDIQPGTIERRLKWNIPGVSIPMIGYIDMIRADTVPIDIKTASRPWKKARFLDEAQPLYYLSALRALGESDNGRFGYLIFVTHPDSEVRVQYAEVHRTTQEIDALEDHVREVWAQISASEPDIYGNPTHPLCNEEWCPYWDRCAKAETQLAIERGNNRGKE